MQVSPQSKGQNCCTAKIYYMRISLYQASDKQIRTKTYHFSNICTICRSLSPTNYFRLGLRVLLSDCCLIAVWLRGLPGCSKAGGSYLMKSLMYKKVTRWNDNMYVTKCTICYNIIGVISYCNWRGWVTEIPDIFYASSVARISYYHNCTGCAGNRHHL
jgi:hypothetical protein